jgi:phosphate transport system protein
MQPARTRFHEELDSLETAIIVEGDLAERAVGRSLDALVHRDDALARDVIAGDDAIDEKYLDVERRVFDLLARQTPVASDLRLVLAILHINLHLERIGDQAVNVAKIALATRNLPAGETVLRHLQEMGDLVREMLRTAMRGFAQRDLDLCLALPEMDEPVDRLNRNMYREIVALAGEPSLLEWGIRINIVSRQLERVGDNAVDIGEQIAFLLTGQFREFTDASHPEVT